MKDNIGVCSTCFDQLEISGEEPRMAPEANKHTLPMSGNPAHGSSGKIGAHNREMAQDKTHDRWTVGEGYL